MPRHAIVSSRLLGIYVVALVRPGPQGQTSPDDVSHAGSLAEVAMTSLRCWFYWLYLLVISLYDTSPVHILI